MNTLLMVLFTRTRACLQACVQVHIHYTRDAQGCITSRVVTLDDPNTLVANVAATSFYPPLPFKHITSVALASDGSVTSTPFGGTTSTGTYSYQWSIGSQTTQSVNNLIANISYIVTVTDDNGCIAIDSVTLTEPTQLTGSLRMSVMRHASKIMMDH